MFFFVVVGVGGDVVVVVVIIVTTPTQPQLNSKVGLDMKITLRYFSFVSSS